MSQKTIAKLEKRLGSLGVEDVKEVVEGLYLVKGQEASVVFETALNHLQGRMSEVEFIKFCEAFE